MICLLHGQVMEMRVARSLPSFSLILCHNTVEILMKGGLGRNYEELASISVNTPARHSRAWRVVIRR